MHIVMHQCVNQGSNLKLDAPNLRENSAKIESNWMSNQMGNAVLNFCSCSSNVWMDHKVNDNQGWKTYTFYSLRRSAFFVVF